MANATPQITTLIPTYRRPRLLMRAIRSALYQTFEDIRVLVVDNASGDETAQVVAEIAREDPRVVYHCHSENIGMTNNFNFAMRQVETPFFSFLSDDDILLPEFYRKALQGFDRYPDAAFSAGGCIWMSERGNSTRLGKSDAPEGYYTPPEGLLKWKLYTHPTITGNLFRRENIVRFGVMSDILAADFELELRIVSAAPYVLSHEPYAVVVQHEVNATRLATPEIRYHSFQIIQATLEGITSLAPELRSEAIRNLRAEFALYTYQLGMVAAIHGEFAYAQSSARALNSYYQQEKLAAKLERTLRLIQLIRPARTCMDLIYNLRQALKNRHHQQLDRHYREYLTSVGR